jgi:hypothetical protein
MVAARRVLAVVATLGLSAGIACDPGGEAISRPGPGSSWAANFVALGDGFTAGVQAGGLTKAYQLQSYPSVLRATLGVRLGSSRDIRHPLVIYPGYSIDVPLAPHGVMGVESLVPLRRMDLAWDDPSLALPFNRDAMHETFEIERDHPLPFRNLGIPDATLYDLAMGVSADSSFWTQEGDEPNVFMDVVLRPAVLGEDLGELLSPLEQARLLDPELVYLWTGFAELDRRARGGREDAAYDATEFEDLLDAVVSDLVGDDIRVVLANVPRLSSLPTYSRLPWVVVDDRGDPVTRPDGTVVSLLGEEGTKESDLQPGVLELDAGTTVLWDAVDALAVGRGIPDPILVARIMADEGVDEATAQGLLDERYPEHGLPLPGSMTIVPGGITALDALADAYGAAVASVAATYGLPLVDTAGLFERMTTEGATYAGIRLDGTNPVTGGFIGLDGTHPTALGYAIIAQEFARVANQAYGAGIPTVDLGAVLEAEIVVGPIEEGRGAPSRRWGGR